MREILFRGKRLDNGEWVFGYFGVFKGRADIFVPFTEEEEKANEGHFVSCVGGLWHPARRETVGQFTGLTDKNGKKIFEGDIVKMSFEGTNREYDGDWSERYFDVDFDGHKIGVITLSGHGTFLKASYGELYVDGEKADWKPARRSRLAAYRSEVIGNIHDNPELLKGGDS